MNKYLSVLRADVILTYYWRTKSVQCSVLHSKRENTDAFHGIEVILVITKVEKPNM